MPYRSYYYSESGALTSELTRSQMQAALESGKGLLWVDIFETTADDGALLADVFHFHRLAIEDCIEEQIHPPKIDDYEDYLFSVFHGVNHSAESAE